MTKTGDVVEKTAVNDDQIDKIVDALEKRAIAEKLPAYANYSNRIRLKECLRLALRA